MTEREQIEDEITDWLMGIHDHSDNEVERELLESLIESIRHGEHRREASPNPDQALASGWRPE
jgi:hypothetical protein